jgi:hypothetical protein
MQLQQQMKSQLSSNSNSNSNGDSNSISSNALMDALMDVLLSLVECQDKYSLVFERLSETIEMVIRLCKSYSYVNLTLPDLTWVGHTACSDDAERNEHG